MLNLYINSLMIMDNKHLITNINDIKIDYDKEPYILIDMSNSTISNFLIKSKPNIKTVIDMERHLAFSIMKKRNIQKAKIIFWDNKNIWIKINDIEQKELVDINHLLTNKIQPKGGTILSQALKVLSFTKKKQINDVYIFTDGEVSDSNADLQKELLRLFQNNVRIHIYTIENNELNYLDDKCSIGNKLFKSIYNMNMTNYIFEFTCHNLKHEIDNGFKNFFNPPIPIDYILFGEYIIHKDNILGLMKLLVGMKLSKMDLPQLIKIIYDLSFTVYQIIKDKNITMTDEIINLFTKPFSNTILKDTIFDILVNDISNIKLGKVQTFHEYRKPKINKSEKSQIYLFDNVKKNISPNGLTFISFPIRINWNNSMIFLIDNKDVNSTLNIRNKVYPNSCFQYQNHNIPVLPIITTGLKSETISCIRQWIFSVYNHQKSYCNTEDMVIYQFLIDVLYIYLSDIRKDVKEIYINLAKIILQEKRDNSELTEYEFLLVNKPALVYGGYKAFYNLMKRCKKINKIKNITVGTLWYAILIVINDEKLKSFHKLQFQYNLIYDSERCKFNWDNDQEIIDHIKLYVNKKYELQDFQKLMNITKNTDSICYISSKSIEETGGYSINEHEILDGIYCKPNMVIGKLSDEHLTCPICHMKLTSEMYKFILPYSTYLTLNDKVEMKENKLLVNR